MGRDSPAKVILTVRNKSDEETRALNQEQHTMFERGIYKTVLPVHDVNLYAKSLSSPSDSTPTVSTDRPGTANTQPNSTMSSFSIAVSATPRSRSNQVLLINPTCTPTLSTILLAGVQEVLPASLEVATYTGPYPAPTAIETTIDAILSSETVIRDLAKHSTNRGETVLNFDAMIVCAFSAVGPRGNSLLTEALRESYDVPVVSTFEASLYVARMLGARFGIIAANAKSQLAIQDAVRGTGLDIYLTGVESLNTSSLDLLRLSSTADSPSTTSSVTSVESSPTSRRGSTSAHTPPNGTKNSQPASLRTSPMTRSDLQKRLVAASKSLIAKGTDTIILGSEFLCHTEFSRIVKDAVREEDGRRLINVLDPVEAAIQMANGLVAMALPTSKKGIYRNEREVRRARGQKWL